MPYAEKDRESWHAGGPFNVEDGISVENLANVIKNYSSDGSLPE